MSTGLFQAVREVADRQPDAVAIRDVDGTPVGYGELVGLVGQLAAGLRAHEVRAGDTIALALENSARYVALILAAARLGACYVPLLRNFGEEQTARAVRNARPVLLVAGREHLVPEGTVSTVALDDLAAGPEAADPGAEEEHTGEFRKLWTSGSTGFPKMMVWRQDKFVTERRRWVADTGVRGDDVFYCRHTLDVAHATDLHVFAALLSGAQLVLADPAAPDTAHLERLQAERATVMSALPAHYAGLARAARGRDDVDLSALRRPLCGGAYLSPAVIRETADALDVRIRQIYGSTEFGLALGDMTDKEQTDGALYPVQGVGVRIEPLDTRQAAGSEIGELVLRSDCTSEGYLFAEEANARTFRGEEFWTGDVARARADGSFQIVGRVSEVLSAAGGPVVAPMLDAEIGAACPGAEAVSLPLDPGRFTDRVTVVVRPAPGAGTAETSRAVKEILAGHGLRGDVHTVGEIPHTEVGKVDKPLLRSRYGRKEPVMEYEKRGTGPVLVLVPGLAASKEFFAPVVDELSRDHTVVTVDLPGHGGTPIGEGATLSGAASGLREVIRHLGLEDVTLVGWSLGATVAWTYLETYGQDAVRGLVSVEQTPWLLSEDGWEYAAFGALDAEGAAGLLNAIGQDPGAFAENLVRQSFAQDSTPDEAEVARLVTHARKAKPEALQELLQDVLAQDWRKRVGGIGTPALLIHGARSVVYPPGVGHWLAEEMPAARLRTFEHSGHLCFLEEPERFATEIRAFTGSEPTER